MKRLIASLLALICIFCFAGCNKEDDEATGSSSNKSVMPVTESSGTTAVAPTDDSTTTTTQKATSQQTLARQTTQTQQTTTQQQTTKTTTAAASAKKTTTTTTTKKQTTTTTTTTTKSVGIDPSLITDSEVLDALMQSGGSIFGQVWTSVYEGLDEEKQQKVKEALATATDKAGNIDYSQFAGIVGSLLGSKK